MTAAERGRIAALAQRDAAHLDLCRRVRLERWDRALTDVTEWDHQLGQNRYRFVTCRTVNGGTVLA